jgi:hypothetical protein
MPALEICGIPALERRAQIGPDQPPGGADLNRLECRAKLLPSTMAGAFCRQEVGTWPRRAMYYLARNSISSSEREIRQALAS